MQPFSLTREQNTANAHTHYNPATSEYLAGGTTLIDLMKLHVMVPSQLVDLTPLPLKKISDLGDRVQVDALVTNNNMAHHALIKTHFPFVSEALLAGASVQLRNLATTAGNVLQRTRCSYFRDTTARCNKRNPGSGCDAIDGYNRMHAILGVSDSCIAAHPSDLCVALMAAGATVQTQSASGKREIPFELFYNLPGSTPHVENTLLPGELIVSVQIPKKSWYKNSIYVKIRDRSSYAFALTSAAVALEVSGGTVKQARIAMGGIGAIPWRLEATEKFLIGQKLTDAVMKQAAKSVTADARAHKHNAFKITLAEQTLIRALQELEQKS